MTSHREGIFVEGLWVEKESRTDAVLEVGSTSAPLLSLAYFIGQQCSIPNDEFMGCKKSSNDPSKCLDEGVNVTRCVQQLIQSVKKSCGSEWDEHWACLDQNNQMMEKCRLKERPFNACVKTYLGLSKVIPDAIGVPIHERSNTQYK